MSDRNRLLRLLTVGAIALSVGACTHSKKVDESVDRQVEAEPSVPPNVPTSVATRQVIAESGAITEKQRSKLLDVHSKMSADVASIRGEMAKLQVILFKKALDPAAEDAEIRNIRGRLLSLDQDRSKRILSALDEAQQILGASASKLDRNNGRQPLIEALDPWRMM